MSSTFDIFGEAIQDYSKFGHAKSILVENNVSDGYEIPVEYLFRSLQEMPEIERRAIDLCGKKVLDVGSAAGVHAKELIAKNHEVTCLDISPKAVEYVRSKGYHAIHKDFFDFNEDSYDSLLFLMNGIGIAKDIDGLKVFLEHCKSLLNPGGNILLDSADLSYLHEDENGEIWIDLNASYYGEVQFRMTYKNMDSGWFPWLFIDFDTLAFYADELGYSCRFVVGDDENQFLAELKLK